ncbi:NME4 isoform 7 [Pongo abelii]|uniref:NME4 isoform 7 n=1 Tax=Pongo abelii TaxID=9601 RepID=A0A2J8R2E7_PONAB|nr:NME4 isoform 7 [Pongo abelii]
MGGLFWRSALQGLRCGPRAQGPSLLARHSSASPPEEDGWGGAQC